MNFFEVPVAHPTFKKIRELLKRRGCEDWSSSESFSELRISQNEINLQFSELLGDVLLVMNGTRLFMVIVNVEIWWSESLSRWFGLSRGIEIRRTQTVSFYDFGSQSSDDSVLVDDGWHLRTEFRYQHLRGPEHHSCWRHPIEDRSEGHKTSHSRDNRSSFSRTLEDRNIITLGLLKLSWQRRSFNPF